MDWKKAKNFTILLLILLNIALMILVYNKQQQYTLSDKQEQAIASILEKNQITLKTPILKNFQPMSDLILSFPEWDINQVKKAFWDMDTEVKMTIESEQELGASGRKIILTKADETILLQNNNLRYKNLKSQYYDEEDIIKYANKYIEKLKPWFNQTILDSIQNKNGKFNIVYYQIFNKKPIFDNKIIITITQEGQIELDMTYLKPEQFTGIKKNICSPDEALLTLMQQSKGSDTNLTITKIDLGYALEEYTTFQNEVKATPYYKIIMNETAYKLNAYTNKISKWEMFNASSNRYHATSY